MIKIEDIDVYGWRPAIRGMRNSMNSWNKSDSGAAVNCAECGLIEEMGICKKSDRVGRCENFEYYYIGENDLKLMQQLSAAGDDDAKFLRMIVVTMDITAPLYWWKEFDTYKVGTVANSCSTMHKIHSKEFTLDDFSCEHLMVDAINAEYDLDGRGTVIHLNGTSAYTMFVDTVAVIDAYRKKYLETGDKRYWWQMIQLLPSSYN